MKQAADQAKVFESSLILLSRTIKKNELTIKQIEKVPADRAVYVPLGKAYLFTKKDFCEGIKRTRLRRLPVLQ
jgi:hypothetical protein